MSRSTRYQFLFGPCMIAAATMSFSSPAAARPEPAHARHWKVMVIIPETHIDRPHIPDPAAETAICKQLIDADYKVVDQGRVSELRYSAVVDRILKGGPSAAKEAMRIGRRFGADVLVAGEAFTTEALRGTIDTELGTVQSIRCECRIELKAVRMDSGEMIFSDAIHRVGPGESSIELSSKACLQDGADAIAPALIQKLAKLLGSTQDVELELRGVPSASFATDVEEALEKISGVLEVSPGSYDAHVDSVELKLSKSAVRIVARRLESSPRLKRFHLRVQSCTASKIVANCGGDD